jgi:hypothetical protein
MSQAFLSAQPQRPDVTTLQMLVACCAVETRGLLVLDSGSMQVVVAVSGRGQSLDLAM